MDETMETVQGDIESAWSAEDPAGEAEGTESAAAVSYTHLTLPTKA